MRFGPLCRAGPLAAACVAAAAPGAAPGQVPPPVAAPAVSLSAPGPDSTPPVRRGRGVCGVRGPAGGRCLVSLAPWAEDVWLDLLDREGTYHGRLAEEGVFQRFHAEMDHEYALDVRTGMFQPWEDAAWFDPVREARGRGRAGFRVAGASVSHPHILNRVDWTDAFDVSEGLALTADYTRDHSLTDRRDYVRVGVRWRPDGPEGWSLRGRMGVHFFKPEADLELGAVRSWGGEGRLRWRMEAAVAAVDAFSDMIFVSLGVDPDEVEAHLDHDGLPLAGRVSLETRGRRWRAELHAGATTARKAEVAFPGAGSPGFRLDERVAFAGAVVEAAPWSAVSVAGHARVARARTERVPPTDAGSGLDVRERTEALGTILRWDLGGEVTAEGELQGVWRPEERREGGEERIHDDRALFAALGLARRPVRGWTGRIAYTSLDRRAGVLLPHVGGWNARLLTEWGYRTVAGFRVVAGLRWDLDGRPAFDGAHLRLTAFRR